MRGQITRTSRNCLRSPGEGLHWLPWLASVGASHSQRGIRDALWPLSSAGRPNPQVKLAANPGRRVSSGALAPRGPMDRRAYAAQERGLRAPQSVFILCRTGLDTQACMGVEMRVSDLLGSFHCVEG